MSLSLNLQEGFVVDYATNVAYSTYNLDNGSAASGEYICTRIIAKGGVPPYLYTLSGSLPDKLVLTNRAGTRFYPEFAELSIGSSVTFDLTTPEFNSVSITVTDSSGQQLTVNGTIRIHRSGSYSLGLALTGSLAEYFTYPTYISSGMAGLKNTELTPFNRCYYRISDKTSISLTATLIGTPKRKATLRCVSKPTFFDFNQPSPDKYIWTIKGKVEATTKDKFYGFRLILEDTSTPDKVTYPDLDLMFFVPGVAL